MFEIRVEVFLLGMAACEHDLCSTFSNQGQTYNIASLQLIHPSLLIFNNVCLSYESVFIGHDDDGAE